MKRHWKYWICACAFVIALVPATDSQAVSEHPVLVIVVEGLRPEFITKGTMPMLTDFSKKGMQSSAHHAVYPALPEVNAASISTGTYPVTHGILDDFSDASLTAPGLAEQLAAGDKSLAIYNATSLDAKRVFGSSITLGVTEGLGAIPEPNAWATQTYLNTESVSDVSVLWLRGVTGELGSPDHTTLLRNIDKQIDAIVTQHRKKKTPTNVFITSSGGSLTETGDAYDLAELLIAHGLKSSLTSGDVIVENGNSIRVEKHDLVKIRAIVALLQQTPWVGAVFTQQIRLTHPEGKAEGALSFQSVYMDHERALDIRVEPKWSDAENRFGIEGTVARIASSDSDTSSPYALQVPLVAFGPDIKSKVISEVPSSNADIAPTIGQLLGLAPASKLGGRVLLELLVDGPAPEVVPVLRRRHGSQAEFNGMTYRMMMTEYTVDGVEYLHATHPERITQQ